MTNPCRINGVDYPSQKAAAAALKVRPTTISKALAAGRENNVNRNLGRLGNTNAKRVPVVAFGRSWPSKWAMARDLGVSRALITRSLKPDASVAHRQLLLAALMSSHAIRKGEA
ncbi:hypothetical protein ACHFJ0_04910 [Paracoccus sp. NGMCC 1.201697]|uniref:Uncharacterized protein n=1 Tax=Paracoccus broussonetiae subsp. drimophilus TaxID=3373869 RepID=A0ABW7LGW3_9RHOB